MFRTVRLFQTYIQYIDIEQQIMLIRKCLKKVRYRRSPKPVGRLVLHALVQYLANLHWLEWRSCNNNRQNRYLLSNYLQVTYCAKYGKKRHSCFLVKVSLDCLSNPTYLLYQEKSFGMLAFAFFRWSSWSKMSIKRSMALSTKILQQMFLEFKVSLLHTVQKLIQPQRAGWVLLKNTSEILRSATRKKMNLCAIRERWIVPHVGHAWTVQLLYRLSIIVHINSKLPCQAVHLVPFSASHRQIIPW